jgi:multiple sugar transport system permease protein
VLCTLPFAAPLLLMLLASLRDPAAPLPSGFSPLSGQPSLQAYLTAFRVVPLGRALLQSAWIAAVAVPVSVLTASWAGLAIVLVRGWQRRALIGLTREARSAGMRLAAAIRSRTASMLTVR